VRARVDGTLRDLAEDISLAKNIKHTIEVVVDRLVIRAGIQKRLADSLEVAFKYGDEVAKVEVLGDGGTTEEIICSQKFACAGCGVWGISPRELTRRLFSSNTP